MIEQTFDVVVIGGGMIGAATALGLAKQGWQVAMVESQEPELYNAKQPMDLRVSAISPLSVELLSELGAWSAIRQMRVCEYQRLETWENDLCRTRFHCQDLGLERLGYFVENRLIQLALWQQIELLPNVQLFQSDQLEKIEFESDHNRVFLQSGIKLKASWVVGADGANSMVRQQANIGVTAWDYRQHCMLIHVETTLPQQNITWQQFTPTGPRSFLPLSGHQASLVWYDSPARIRQLKHLSKQDLRLEVLQNFPRELGDITVLKQGSFPLTRRHAQSYVQQRCILVGDAAHTINPLAGQGVNLGFKDVKALLGVSCFHDDTHNVFTDAGLALYQSKRRQDNLLMQTGMDLFYKGFSNDLAPVKLLRNSMLKLANHSGILKNKALQYALGL